MTLAMAARPGRVERSKGRREPGRAEAAQPPTSSAFNPTRKSSAREGREVGRSLLFQAATSCAARSQQAPPPRQKKHACFEITASLTCEDGGHDGGEHEEEDGEEDVAVEVVDAVVTSTHVEVEHTHEDTHVHMCDGSNASHDLVAGVQGYAV